MILILRYVPILLSISRIIIEHALRLIDQRKVWTMITIETWNCHGTFTYHHVGVHAIRKDFPKFSF